MAKKQVKEILRYLNKYYSIEDEMFVNRFGEPEWGYAIDDELPKVLNYDRYLCSRVLVSWCSSKGLKSVVNAWGIKPYVVGGTNRINANWTPEMALEISAFHSIDAEAELTAILSEQIATEIDREILSAIISTNLNEFDRELSTMMGYYNQINIIE